MSSAKPKPIAEINLEEFERRLRASAAPAAGVEDPLAELTRLVDTIGFERSPSERALELARARPAQKPELRLAPPPEPPPTKLKPAEPAPPPSEAVAPPPPVADIAPPSLEDAAPTLRPAFDVEDLDSLAIEPPAPMRTEAEARPPAPPAAAARRAPVRARHWGLKVGGLVGAAVVMAGAVVVFKLGSRTHSGPPPLILASTAPTKVAPPNDETIRTANESGSLLTRDTAQPAPTPPKLVNPPEAPVDLAARPQPSASASAPAAPVAAVSPAPSAEAESSPVAPSSDTPIVASVEPRATPQSPIGADPNRVKTISVRPDGSLISSGYEAPAAAKPLAPAPAPTETIAAAAEPSTPAVALPTKLAPPKASTRVVAKTPTTAPADEGAGPAPVAPKAKPPAPAAEAAPTDDGAGLPAAPSGGYAVQLAAPRSESDAKALIKRLQSRFADALDGTALGVRKAERDGQPIYRVRAGGLSRSAAAAMCAKVKAAGGDCYVAKN